MATKKFISYLVISVLCLQIFHGTEGLILKDQKQGKIWCVARNDIPDYKLRECIDFYCGPIDCGPIQRGGICYEPNTLANHASYVLDASYRESGICDASIGTPAVSDPSFGRCQYP